MRCTFVRLQASLGDGKAKGGGSQGRPIWCPTLPWRGPALSVLDGANADAGQSHHLGVELLIGSL